MENQGIKTLEQARQVISNLQSLLDKERRKLNIARAIIFELQYANAPEPTEADLKARVVMLEQELQDAIDKRQKLKAIIASKLED